MKTRTIYERKSLLSQEQVLEILKPFLPIIVSVWEAAHKFAMLAIPSLPAARPTVLARTLANVRYYHASTKLKEALQGEKDIRVDESGKLMRFIVGNAVSVRLKKLNRRRTSSNIQTVQQWEIRRQHLIFDSNLTQVEAGYQLDATGLEIEAFYVTCPRDFGANYWDFKINDDPAKSTPLFPSTHGAQSRDIVIRRRQKVAGQPVEAAE